MQTEPAYNVADKLHVCIFLKVYMTTDPLYMSNTHNYILISIEISQDSLFV